MKQKEKDEVRRNRKMKGGGGRVDHKQEQREKVKCMERRRGGGGGSYNRWMEERNVESGQWKKNQEEEKTGGSMKGMRGRMRGGGRWRIDLHCCIHQTTSLLFSDCVVAPTERLSWMQQ